ncbi:hypothetical protein BYT27DRAFT_7203211 [Phlegmacium glaucopus]|nr:hypothetical protein BYT27DRAFT_7203211 [Phlegmacium glaucopus]
MSLIKESLEIFHVKCKLAPPAINDKGMEILRLRISGHDPLKGWIDVERFAIILFFNILGTALESCR